MSKTNIFKSISINNLEDSFKIENTSIIFRCPKCYEIPFVTQIFKDNNYFIKINCRNKCLINIIKQDEYINMIKEKSIYNFKECNICNEKKSNNNLYYIDFKNLNEKKIICQKCLSSYKLEDKYKTIFINEFDSICLKHNNKIISYCNICSKDCCMYCVEEEHKFHKVTSILELHKNINLEEFEKTFNNIDIIKSNIEKMKKLFIEIEQSFNKKKNQFNQAIKEYEKNIEIFNFFAYCYYNYKILNIQKNYNYEMLYNILNYKSFNINEFNDSIEFDNEINKLNKMIKFLNQKIINQNLKDTKITSIIPTNCSINNITQLFSGDIAIASYNSHQLLIYKNNTYEKIFSKKINYCKYIQQLHNGDLIVVGEKIYIFSIDYNNIKNENFLTIKNPIRPIQNYSYIDVIKLYEMNNNQFLLSFTTNNLDFYNTNDYDLIIKKNYIFYDAIQINNEEIVGKSSNSLIFLNINNKEKIGEIQNIKCNTSNNSLCLIENKILGECGQKNIYLIDLINKQITINIETNQNYNNIIKLFNGTIIIKDENGILYEYQYLNKNLYLLSEKKIYGCITIYQLFNQQILAGLNDKIQIFN